MNLLYNIIIDTHRASINNYDSNIGMYSTSKICPPVVKACHNGKNL